MKTIGRKLSEVLDFSAASSRAKAVDFQVPVITPGPVVEKGPLPLVIGGRFLKWGSNVHEETFDHVAAVDPRAADGTGLTRSVSVIERQSTPADGGPTRDRFYVQSAMTGRNTDMFETVGVGDDRTIVGHVNSDGSAEDPNGP